MAWYPGAIRKPITASKGRKKLTVYNRMNLHVAVSEGSSLHAFFNKSGQVDSHFYVRRDGTVEQYVDTAYRAFADLEGNDATISVETQGMGPGEWTPQQRESLAQLYAWAVKKHGIARKMASSSKIGKASQGLSWHRLGCDGNFPSLPSILAGRGQRGGGMHYSRSLGKVCPGDDRVKQIPSIFARAEAILGGATTPNTQEEPMAGGLDTTQAKQLSTIHHILTDAVVEDFDRKQTVTNTLRRLLVLARRNGSQDLDAAVARGVKAYAASTPGVDEAKLTAGVVAEVRKAVTALTDSVEGTEYVLTPKEN